MIPAFTGNAITVCIVGIAIFWGWAALMAEAIARRTGKSRKVPYPDQVLWELFGHDLLDLGLFGGAPTWEQRSQEDAPWRPLRGRQLPSQPIAWK
jgi:hypothetical protein